MSRLPPPPRPLPPGWWWKCFRLYILLGGGCGLLVAVAGGSALTLKKPADATMVALFEKGQQAQAKITKKDTREIPSGRRVNYQRYVIYTFTADGKEITTDREIEHEDTWFAVDEGKTLPVVYDPAKPDLNRFVSERAFYTEMQPLINPKICFIIAGIGILVVVSNFMSYRQETRYFSHGIELSTDVEKVEENDKEITYKCTYIFEGREYWKREKVPKGVELVRAENNRGVLIMQPRKPDRVTLITRNMYDVPPPSPPEE
jgi:hypothetical protein